jgi:hypothetical protein
LADELEPRGADDVRLEGNVGEVVVFDTCPRFDPDESESIALALQDVDSALRLDIDLERPAPRAGRFVWCGKNRASLFRGHGPLRVIERVVAAGGDLFELFLDCLTFPQRGAQRGGSNEVPGTSRNLPPNEVPGTSRNLPPTRCPLNEVPQRGARDFAGPGVDGQAIQVSEEDDLPRRLDGRARHCGNLSAMPRIE